MITRKVRSMSVILLGVLAAPTLSGCAGSGINGANLGTAIGAIGGAIGGSVIGRQIGGTSGQVIGGIVGAGVGGLIGRQIGRYLDPEEQQQASYAKQQALDSQQVGPNSTRTWDSPTNLGTYGATTVTQQIQAPDGRECKQATSFAKVKGQDVKEFETYCRNPQTGGWVLQAA